MAQVLRHLPANKEDPNLLVGIDYADDAGVYKLTDEIALIQTLDFFTPIVDDPYMFGQIAAANSLSDVYAMGGKPLTVMNIVGFEVKKLGPEILADILRGGADKVIESGAVIVGGHSVDDAEPKYGLSVTGICHPDKFWANKGAKPGDALILTKPIGTGIVTTAIKRGAASQADIDLVTETMATLNKVGAEVLMDYQVNACTDITGFGLLGHALEMAKASEVHIKLDLSQIPILPNTKDFTEKGMIPGGTRANLEWIKVDIAFDPAITPHYHFILADAVTSGGLLASIPADQAEAAIAQMQEKGIDARIIGRVVESGPGPTIKIEQKL